MKYIKKNYLSKFFENKDGSISDEMLKKIKDKYFKCLDREEYKDTPYNEKIYGQIKEIDALAK